MEKNFDKWLKDILENPPNFEPTATDLELMRSKIGQQKTRPWWIWLLPLMLLSFLVGGYLAFEKIENLSDKITQLEAASIEMNTAQNHAIIDSTIRKTTYVYDTVYRRVYKDVYVKNEILQSPNSAENHGLSLGSDGQLSIVEWQSMADLLERVAVAQNWVRRDGNGQFVIQNDALTNSLFFQNTEENQANSAENVGKIAENQVFDLKSMSAVPFGKTLYPKAIAQHTSAWAFPKKMITQGEIPKSKSVNPLLYTIPRGLSVGIAGSPLAFAPIPKSTKKYAYEYGISADVHFPKNVRLESGVFLANASIYTKDVGLQSQFPQGAPDAPNHVFKELKGTLSYLRIPFVFSKTFVKERRRFAPVVGLGIVAQKPIRQSLTYEYIDDVGTEYYRKSTFRNGLFAIANPYFSLGAATDLGTAYRLTMKGFYQHNGTANVGTIVPQHYFGLRLGIDRKVF